MFGNRKAEDKITDENTHVVVSTSGSQRRFDVIDTVCEFSQATAGFDGVRMQEAFSLVKNKLRALAIERGGDAVIDCQFAQRFAHSGGLAAVQVLELWAIGTVVKFKDDA